MSGYAIYIKATKELVGYAETSRSALQSVRYATICSELHEDDFSIICLI